VYEEIVFPPVAPAVNGTETAPLPEVVAVPIVGACGIVVAVIEPADVDGPVAVALVAVTAIA
jgi:hypothetical protein